MPTGTTQADAAVLPPILRVGTDLCSVSEVAKSVERFGDRYLKRVYTEGELAYCMEAPSQSAERLAARFAAKEATMKVLRPEHWRPDWRTIDVQRHPGGWCELVLTGSAAELAEDAGITSLAVSVSHEGALASAVVMAQVSAG